MPKSIFVNPDQLRKPSKITFTDIPINSYNKTFTDEKDSFTKVDLMRIYRDMRTIREFEQMLLLIKTTEEYNGIKYNHPGPAHLSLGQEASAVGQAYLLSKDDYIFGSHRSHGEILAKGLSAIHKLSDKELIDIMSTFFGGNILRIIEGKQNTSDVKELAMDFLLYGALAEIFARETGFHKGLGGSMHAFFTPFGIYPNNAIVGGSGTISLGGALFKHINKQKGVVICNIGDGSLGCGPVMEAINMSVMDQIRMLWEEGYNKGLPLIFNIFNNNYGMGGQTVGETMGYDVLARIGAGVNPEQMHSERVDGYNPLAVIDAYRRKLATIAEGKGPILLDVLTYRMTGHSPSDSSSYRTPEEIAAWKQHDVIQSYREKAAAEGIASLSEFDAIDADVIERMTKICRMATDPAISPYMDLRKNPTQISNLMFSNTKQEKMAEGKPDVLMPYEENPRVQKIAKSSRYAFDDNGKPVPKAKLYSLRDGIFEAVAHCAYTDPTFITFGEDVRDWGGAFAVYRGLTEALPYHRLFNTPISEAAIAGSAVGYALCGGRCIAELMYCDFLGRAGDEVFNQLSKWQAMSAGVLKMPAVLRVSVGSKYGAQHSQDWTALTAHIPGLKVVFPATPYDAKGLMNSALSGTDPVIFFESQRIYDIGEMFHKQGVPQGYYEIPIGEPDVKKVGSDITILSIGATLYRVLDAVKILEEKYNLSVEVIDARSIVPFNYEPVLQSVRKTGRILLTGDACERGSIMETMAANITQFAFDYLDAPPVVVGARNWITPAYEIEDAFFPQPDWIVDAVHENILPLAGHVCKQNFTDGERIRRNAEGV